MSIIRRISLRLSVLAITCFVLVSAQPLSAQTCSADMRDDAPDDRYIDNLDGTVTDQYTQLMWKQCDEGFTTDGASACVGALSNMNWDAAIQLADDVNKGDAGENLGYIDWRLPNIKELVSLHRATCTQPALNTSAFPQNTDTVTWSSTPRWSNPVGEPTLARFNVFDTFGGDFYSSVNTSNSGVRLVRDARSKLLFISNRNGGNDIYGMFIDGSNLINLTNDSLNYISASLSPDGMKIASKSSIDNGDGTYTLTINIMDTDGASQVNIASSNVDIRALFIISLYGNRLAWSSDGSQVAFSKAVELSPATETEAAVYTYNIFVINADGANQQNLTDSLSANITNLSPSWSSDGSKIVFSRFNETPGTDEIPASSIGNIFMMNANGSGEQNITNNVTKDTGFITPILSPDGTKIAYINLSEGADLYVMNVNGSSRINLTNDTSLAALKPVWSSDGSKIAFTSAIDANYEIYVIDADGSNLMNISNNPAHDQVTDW